MYLNKSINNKNLQDMTIKSLVWNSIVEVFKQEKKLDIVPYLVSIQLKGKSIIIKVNKPIIKSEVLLLDDIINQEVQNKFKKVGIKFYDFEIKYSI
ncbi:hypothetical protein EOM39_05650 [Candidatus Gracilibacteria bacterium]|nr:hypothetical protein [Candidatus Gracilibacteria bacterium]